MSRCHQGGQWPEQRGLPTGALVTPERLGVSSKTGSLGGANRAVSLELRGLDRAHPCSARGRAVREPRGPFSENIRVFVCRQLAWHFFK